MVFVIFEREYAEKRSHLRLWSGQNTFRFCFLYVCLHVPAASAGRTVHASRRVSTVCTLYIIACTECLLASALPHNLLFLDIVRGKEVYSFTNKSLLLTASLNNSVLLSLYSPVPAQFAEPQINGYDTVIR